MQANLNIQKFVNDLTNKYSHYFDVHKGQQLEDLDLAFLAIHKRRDERYMLSKKFKIYGIENQDIVFASIHEDKLTEDYIQRFTKSMEANFKSYIDEHDEHMSSIVYGIIVTNEEVDQAIVKQVTKYRKVKFLKFGLHGWVELYLIVVNPNRKQVWVHPKGKTLVTTIENLINMESAVKCH